MYTEKADITKIVFLNRDGTAIEETTHNLTDHLPDLTKVYFSNDSAIRGSFITSDLIEPDYKDDLNSILGVGGWKITQTITHFVREDLTVELTITNHDSDYRG